MFQKKVNRLGDTSSGQSAFNWASLITTSLGQVLVSFMVNKFDIGIFIFVILSLFSFAFTSWFFGGLARPLSAFISFQGRSPFLNARFDEPDRFREIINKSERIKQYLREEK